MPLFYFRSRFDDVLNYGRLQIALSRLPQLGNWRKLCACICRNVKGGPEYHVPNALTTSGLALCTPRLHLAQRWTTTRKHRAWLGLTAHRLDMPLVCVALYVHVGNVLAAQGGWVGCVASEIFCTGCEKRPWKSARPRELAIWTKKMLSATHIIWPSMEIRTCT